MAKILVRDHASDVYIRTFFDDLPRLYSNIQIWYNNNVSEFDVLFWHAEHVLRAVDTARSNYGDKVTIFMSREQTTLYPLKGASSPNLKFLMHDADDLRHCKYLHYYLKLVNNNVQGCQDLLDVDDPRRVLANAITKHTLYDDLENPVVRAAVENCGPILAKYGVCSNFDTLKAKKKMDYILKLDGILK